MTVQDREAARSDRTVTVWSPWGPQKITLAERRQERMRRAAEHAGKFPGTAVEDGGALS